jgi:hypothetical protein
MKTDTKWTQLSNGYDEFVNGKITDESREIALQALLNDAKPFVRFIKVVNPITGLYLYRADLLVGELDSPKNMEEWK